MDLNQALAFAGRFKTATLVTIRRDGRPQSSDISYDISNGAFRISVTADRAKTHNMRRDPRVVVHLSAPDSWSYVSLDGVAELSDVASDPGDATCLLLAEQYESAAGKAHPDWDEFFEAMVADQRLLVQVRPTSAVGVIR